MGIDALVELKELEATESRLAWRERSCTFREGVDCAGPLLCAADGSAVPSVGDDSPPDANDMFPLPSGLSRGPGLKSWSG